MKPASPAEAVLTVMSIPRTHKGPPLEVLPPSGSPLLSHTLFPHTEGAGRHSQTNATYVSFSSGGSRLVATYHGDHAYTFDVALALSGALPPSATMRLVGPSGSWRSGGGEGGGASSGNGNGAASSLDSPRQQGGGASSSFPQGKRPRGSLTSLGPSPRRPSPWSGDDAVRVANGCVASANGGIRELPEDAEEARRRGNRLIFDEDWTAAVDTLSEAVRLAPWCAALYARRAEALLGRVRKGVGWMGGASCGSRPRLPFH